MKFITALLLLLLTFTLAFSSQSPKTNKTKASAGGGGAVGSLDYEIYSAIIKYLNRQNNNLFIGVVDETVASTAENFTADEHFELLSGHFKELYKDTLVDFDLKNKKPVKLNNQFRGEIKFIFLNKGIYEKDYPNTQVGWEQFFIKNPDAIGVLKVSRVGFNKENNQAFVYASYVCGADCGKGKFILLTKEDNKWELKRDMIIWKSQVTPK